MIRKTIFWTHLVCGVISGIAVFTMSLTGVLLTYERQINNWVAEGHYVEAPESASPMPLEELLKLQALAQPDQAATALLITNDPGAPVTFRAGRRGGLSLNPYTGETMETQSPALEGFFGAVTSFHRWFSIEGENRVIARQITGISNVMFLFLVLSGMYLWLPKIWKWGLFKARLLFRGEYPNSKTRDFHWHHIFGIWAAIPLVAVVYSGAVISYPWAANVMYVAFGAEIPVPQGQGGPGGGGNGGPPQGQGQAQGANQPAGQGQNGENRAPRQAGSVQSDGTATVYTLADSGETSTFPIYLPLDTVLAKATAAAGDDWNRLTLTLPEGKQNSINVEIDRGNGAQAFKRHTLSLDRATGDVLKTQGFADMPEAQRLRGITRFLHTGEVLGFWGQTIAGLASFAALFMVWTGFALSWRRLIQPLFKK
ncbi:MAG: PepSY-associated TM helix domain-containing protein [Pseudomonadota bacterium]